jgi:potassium voltage-gated channel Eag-related subfamily H protein 1/potassium voltage-gated channel Eag-related subfamily H protein 5
MISVGYGDITPKNTPEVLITTFTMFVSCILFAYSINAIWEVIRELNENRYKFDKHVTAMSRFMYDHGVSRKLNTKINAYLSHMWDKDRKRDIESE